MIMAHAYMCPMSRCVRQLPITPVHIGAPAEPARPVAARLRRGPLGRIRLRWRRTSRRGRLLPPEQNTRAAAAPPPTTILAGRRAVHTTPSDRRQSCRLLVTSRWTCGGESLDCVDAPVRKLRLKQTRVYAPLRVTSLNTRNQQYIHLYLCMYIYIYVYVYVYVYVDR